MKSEQEVQDRINRLEQVAENHYKLGDWDSHRDASNSIRQLRWVLDKDSSPSTEEDTGMWREDDGPSEIYLVVGVEAGLGPEFGPCLGTLPIAAYHSQERAEEHANERYDQLVATVTIEDGKQ